MNVDEEMTMGTLLAAFPLITHDVADQLRGTLTAFFDQVGVDTPIPVGSLRVFEIVSDPGAQRVTPHLGGRLWAAPPVVKTRR